MVKKPKIVYPNSTFIKDLWDLLGENKFQFSVITVILAIAFFLGLVPAIIISKIVDFLVQYSSGQSLRMFYFYMGILLFLGVFNNFLRLGAKHFFWVLTGKIRKNLRVDAFQKIINGDLLWHDKENVGNKMQRINEGDSSFQSFLDFFTNKLLDLLVSTVSIVVIFAFLNIKYAIIAVIFILVYLFFEFKLNKTIINKTIELKIAREKSVGKTYEFSSNMNTVKSLGIEHSLSKRVINQEQKVLNLSNIKQKLSTYKWISIQTVAVVFHAIFIFLIGRDVILRLLTVGSIIIYISYFSRLREGLNTLSTEFSRLIDLKYGIYRMLELYKSIPYVYEGKTVYLREWKRLEIKDLDFKYKNEEVLEGLNLIIKKGSKIGVVGKSGSGKSTLFKLLLKLYLPQKGMIYFDDKQITEIKRKSLFSKISVVPQETELFNLSFRENILISSTKKFDFERYEKALKISGCLPIISKLKERDLTLIGEKGVRLSGGERQRLGIARAIYKDSDILIFDEATSNLDYETEKNIIQYFDKELKNKTLIISAHRLSSLKNMDNIIVINKGKVIEIGTYNQLLKNKGVFYKLWKHQDK